MTTSEATATIETLREHEAAVADRSRLAQRFPDRVVVGANGAYWRDYGDFYSMCPVSDDNDPVVPVAVYALVGSEGLGRTDPGQARAIDEWSDSTSVVHMSGSERRRLLSRLVDEFEVRGWRDDGHAALVLVRFWDEHGSWPSVSQASTLVGSRFLAQNDATAAEIVEAAKSAALLC